MPIAFSTRKKRRLATFLVLAHHTKQQAEALQKLPPSRKRCKFLLTALQLLLPFPLTDPYLQCLSSGPAGRQAHLLAGGWRVPSPHRPPDTIEARCHPPPPKTSIPRRILKTVGDRLCQSRQSTSCSRLRDWSETGAEWLVPPRRRAWSAAYRMSCGNPCPSRA